MTNDELRERLAALERIESGKIPEGMTLAEARALTAAYALAGGA